MTTNTKKLLFNGTLNNESYPKFRDDVIIAINHLRLSAELNQFYYRLAHHQDPTIPFTQQQWNAITVTRKTIDSLPAEDDPLYKIKNSKILTYLDKLDNIRYEIIATLTEDARSSLFMAHIDPSLEHMLTYIHTLYGTTSTETEQAKRHALSKALTWPTRPAEKQTCIDEMRARFDSYVRHHMQKATPAEQEALKLERLLDATKATIAVYPELHHITRDMPKVYDYATLFGVVELQMHNWDCDRPQKTILPSANIATNKKGTLQMQPSKENSKFCLCHKYNANHESHECFAIMNFINKLTDPEIKQMKANAETNNKGKKKGKKSKAKITTKLATVETDSDSEN